MLAYAFWHWRTATADAAAYEALLGDFLAALTAAPPPGLHDARSTALQGAPWANNGSEAYEDWYVVGGSADLDPLNEAAVTAGRQVPHDRVAAVAAGGIAGLYRLRQGRHVPDARHAVWFSKPAGMSYPDLYAALAPAVAGGGALWGRQMTLGPTPEFCLRSAVAPQLPAAWATLPLPLRPV